MNIFKLFRRTKSAPVARERLQVLLAHERASQGRSELITRMREEIVAVIARHTGIESKDVRVKINRRKTISTLKVDIEIPPLPDAA